MNGHFLLTDDGDTMQDLESSGCSLGTPKRQQLLKATLNDFGVKMNHEELQVTATAENFPLRKHSLIQAMLAVNDLFYLAEPIVESLFFEDVVAWLDLSDIRYTPKVKFTGTSGYDHLFDFVIPKSRQAPERIINAINQPSRSTALTFINSWTETREVRASESKAYAILNYSEQQVSANVTEALNAYDIRPILWSKRENHRDLLAA